MNFDVRVQVRSADAEVDRWVELFRAYTLGAHPSADIRLDGLRPIHAILYAEGDEIVLEELAVESPWRVALGNGAVAQLGPYLVSAGRLPPQPEISLTLSLWDGVLRLLDLEDAGRRRSAAWILTAALGLHAAIGVAGWAADPLPALQIEEVLDRFVEARARSEPEEANKEPDEPKTKQIRDSDESGRADQGASETNGDGRGSGAGGGIDYGRSALAMFDAKAPPKKTGRGGNGKGAGKKPTKERERARTEKLEAPVDPIARLKEKKAIEAVFRRHRVQLRSCMRKAPPAPTGHVVFAEFFIGKGGRIRGRVKLSTDDPNVPPDLSRCVRNSIQRWTGWPNPGKWRRIKVRYKLTLRVEEV